MSRIGNAIVQIGSGVEVSNTSGVVVVKGPKGELSMNIDPTIQMEIEGDIVSFKRKSEVKKVKSLHGLTRALFANMVKGVTEGWTKKLELVGVGYRAQSSGDEHSSAPHKLNLSVGFSHPVEITAPFGIQFEVTDNTGGASGTKLTVSGIDKNLVGQVAANIRAIKPPEPYKGKGIRYEGEYIKRKAGKAGKVGAGAPK